MYKKSSNVLLIFLITILSGGMWGSVACMEVVSVREADLDPRGKRDLSSARSNIVDELKSELQFYGWGSPVRFLLNGVVLEEIGFLWQVYEYLERLARCTDCDDVVLYKIDDVVDSCSYTLVWDANTYTVSMANLAFEEEGSDELEEDEGEGDVEDVVGDGQCCHVM